MTPQDSAQAKLAARLASRAAHCLNNVAAVLSGHIYLLRNASESQQEALESIEKAMEHLDRITRNLTSVGALGVDEAESLDVNEIVRAAAGSGVGAGAVKLDLSPQLPPMTARREDLTCAIEALIVNAREASLPSQRIRVSTAHHPDEGILIIVEDAGNGVPPEVRRRNFEPFFSTKGVKGRGIGLTLATVAALLGGGSFSIEDRAEGGTRATLRVPVDSARDAGADVKES